MIKYYNTVQTKMDNVVCTLWQGGSPTAFVAPATGTNGIYTFNNVCPGNYTIVAVSNKVMLAAINATDASQLNSWVAAPSAIEKVRYYAGDVTGSNYGGANPGGLGTEINGVLDGTDAQRILYYFAYNGNIPAGTEGGPLYSLRGTVNAPNYWTFWKNSDLISSNGTPTSTVDYTPVTAPNGGGTVTTNLWALATGDFNRSFVPATGPSSGKGATSKNLSLDYKGAKTATANSVIDLPVRAEGTMTVGAGSVIMNIPGTKLEIVDVKLQNSPDANLIFHVNGNELRIGWYGGAPINVTAGQTLFTIKVRTNGTIVKTDDLTFSLVDIDLNELADAYSNTIPDAVLAIEQLNATGDALGTGDNGTTIASGQGMSLANYPNPFAGTTTFDYLLPESGKVTLEVYNLVGEKVMVLINEVQQAGDHYFTVDASTLSTGFYTATLRLKTETGVQTKTIKIIRN
jgi:hypothetical protein